MNYVELQHMEKCCIRVSTAWNLAIMWFGIIVGVTSAFPVFLLSLLRSATLTLIALGTGDWFAFFRRAEASAKQARGTKNANK